MHFNNYNVFRNDVGVGILSKSDLNTSVVLEGCLIDIVLLSVGIQHRRDTKKLLVGIIYFHQRTRVAEFLLALCCQRNSMPLL